MSRGLLLAFLSGGVTATSSLIVKLGSSEATVLQTVFFRNVIMMSILCMMLVVSGEITSLLQTRLRTIAWILARSVFSFIGLATLYALYRLIPLGDAAAIAGSAPICAGLFGFLILGETLSTIHVILCLICWLGVALVAQTKDSADAATIDSMTDVSSTYLIKIVLCIASPTSIALSLVLSRKVSKDGKVLHVMIVTFFGAACCALVNMAVTEGVGLPNTSSWKYLLCDALGGLVSQFLLTKALTMENVAPCALMRNSRVVVGFLYQIIIYHQSPTLQTIVGSAIIVGSTAMVSLLKQ